MVVGVDVLGGADVDEVVVVGVDVLGGADVDEVVVGAVVLAGEEYNWLQ